MTFDKVFLLPLAVFVIFPCTFLSTYIAAVLLGHVEPDFPYISDTGANPPESCVFGEFINLGSFLLIVVVYIRHRQVEEYHRSFSLSSSIVKLNNISLWFGFTSCVGLTLVANFQETNVYVVHYLGAFMCFGLGTVYFWLQAVCSYYMHPLAHGMGLAHLRLGLSMICTVFYILVVITGIASRHQFHGENPQKWYPADGGWALHVISTASEWVVAIAFCAYILTFVQEFRTISVEQPRVILNMDRLHETTPVIGQAEAREVNITVAQGSSQRPIVT